MSSDWDWNWAWDWGLIGHEVAMKVIKVFFVIFWQSDVTDWLTDMINCRDAIASKNWMNWRDRILDAWHDITMDGMLWLTWYDDDVRLVADALVAVQLRDHHDPVLGHGHDPSGDGDGDRELRSCLGHSLSPCCPLALSLSGQSTEAGDTRPHCTAVHSVHSVHHLSQDSFTLFQLKGSKDIIIFNWNGKI